MELKVSYNCIGFVGINESGKSNVLSAIRVLGGERRLTEADTPKMDRKNPFITYSFKLNDEEFSFLQSKCNSLFKQYISELDGEIITEKSITYNIVFDRQKNSEDRYFDFSEIRIKENLMILRPDKYVGKYQIKTSEGFKDIESCRIITNNDFQLHIELEQKIEKLMELQELLVQKENTLNKLLNPEIAVIGDDELSDKNEVKEDVIDTEQEHSNNVLNLKNEISYLKNNIKIVLDEIKDYKVPNVIKEIEKRNVSLDLNIKNELTNKSSLNEELKKLKAIQSLTADQTERIKEIEIQIKKSDNNILTNKNKIEENNNTLVLLKEPISEKYTNEDGFFINLIKDNLNDYLYSMLPRVVFWEYDEKYLQESIINLDELMQQNELVNIPRPLINIFRISFGISLLDDIKAKIKEAQRDGNERSRISDQLTDSVNNFLHNIWSDYDQKIKITIEEKELRVAIFDPDKKYASYYSLIERSQGCKTFISFLLTIGAEANKKVLKNTILLLDEPETHLHPSGVKFMLKELIKIAGTENNIVFYTTHSMFMIDRHNFGRHIIIKKNNEISQLIYAYSNRIGSFMQEEVLYNALNIEFSEFDSTGNVNFVFEGYGDAILFKTVYSLISKESIPFPLDDCVFHHGGGCENIMKYLIHRSIRMNTKWIFILDSDKPAEKLKKFIESEYKNCINESVFIFQYFNSIENAELEDLLPNDIKLKVYNSVLSSENKDLINEDNYFSLIKNISSFSEQYREICEKFDLVGSNIKGLFKEKLNQEIENDIKNVLNNKNVLKEKYNNYLTWFESTLESYQKALVLEKKDNVKQEVHLPNSAHQKKQTPS
ncbi:AAA family ATPase [Treponema sp. R8-4-B8]